MRFYLLVIALLLTGSMAIAQNPPPAENLASVLRDWEQATSKAKDLACEIHRSTLDKALATKDAHNGFVLFLRDGKADRVRYELSNSATKQLSEKLILTDKDFFEYVPASKTVRVRALPKGKNGAAQQPAVMSLILGADTAQRFNLTLVAPASPDPNYQYIRILPKTPADKAEFREARLTLMRANHLPRQIWFLAPNGTEQTWDFTNVKVNGSLNKKLLNPDVAGWKVIQVNVPPPPKKAP